MTMAPLDAHQTRRSLRVYKQRTFNWISIVHHKDNLALKVLVVWIYIYIIIFCKYLRYKPINSGFSKSTTRRASNVLLLCVSLPLGFRSEPWFILSAPFIICKHRNQIQFKLWGQEKVFRLQCNSKRLYHNSLFVSFTQDLRLNCYSVSCFQTCGPSPNAAAARLYSWRRFCQKVLSNEV